MPFGVKPFLRVAQPSVRVFFYSHARLKKKYPGRGRTQVNADEIKRKTLEEFSPRKILVLTELVFVTALHSFATVEHESDSRMDIARQVTTTLSRAARHRARLALAADPARSSRATTCHPRRFAH